MCVCVRVCVCVCETEDRSEHKTSRAQTCSDRDCPPYLTLRQLDVAQAELDIYRERFTSGERQLEGARASLEEASATLTAKNKYILNLLFQEARDHVSGVSVPTAGCVPQLHSWLVCKARLPSPLVEHYYSWVSEPAQSERGFHSCD